MMEQDKTKSSEKVVQLLKTRLQAAQDAYDQSRQSELKDLKFLAGSPDNKWQWDEGALASRSTPSVNGQLSTADRPCLTINRLPQHVNQVTNDQRQNMPRGKVIPVDDKGDIKVAEFFMGMIRHIEYISDADVAYKTACDNQVTFGEGYVRVVPEYCDPDSFNQEIKIKRIRNSFKVFMDPTIECPAGSDAEWCIIEDDMEHEEYEAKYPDASTVSKIMESGTNDQSLTEWYTDNSIRIAEYFYKDYFTTTLYLFAGNITASAKEGESIERLTAMYGKPLKERKVRDYTVKWVKSNGVEILEETEWLGRYVPVFRVIGNEYEVDGQLHISGLIRNATDPQRLYNYWSSQEAEMLALAPKAPFIGYGGQFQGYEAKWATANTKNWAYLEVNPDVKDGNGAVLPLPQRAAPPLAQTGLIQAKMGAADDIKAVTGQYNASLGQQSNERSGKAILARQKESDTGTFHYVDNLALAVRCVTRCLVDAIPKYYDVYQVKTIIGDDGKTKNVGINPSQVEGIIEQVDPNQPDAVLQIFNPNVGKYDVIVTTGPGYETKRQQSLAVMSDLIQTNPELWKIAGDLFVKSIDMPEADRIAERLQRAIDPKLLEDSQMSPILKAAQDQNEQLTAQLQQMQQMLQNAHNSLDAKEVQVKEFEAQVKAYDAETKRISATQAGMTHAQIQDIIMGTLAAALQHGDLLGNNLNESPVHEYSEQQQPEFNGTDPEDQARTGAITLGGEE
jgi:hypothetical protein